MPPKNAKAAPKPAPTAKPIKVPDHQRQVRFYQLLLGARRTWLRDALQETLGKLDQPTIKAEIAKLVPGDAQAVLATAGIRDEYVFPTPTIIRARPSLLAYYRLLLGQPRKSFYGSEGGRGLFQSMETSGKVTPKQDARLDELIAAMIAALADLVRQMAPTMSQRDVDELPLLTLGSQLQGANNVAIGQEGTAAVFAAIRSIVEMDIVSESGTELVVTNAAGRKVYITLAADPDVRIREEFGTGMSYKVAIEIKAGTDQSNAHNRAGEAEKSHQKAEDAGATDFWTIITKRGLDMAKLRAESPRTRSWFDVAQVLAGEGEDWDAFRRRIIEAVGIRED